MSEENSDQLQLEWRQDVRDQLRDIKAMLSVQQVTQELKLVEFEKRIRTLETNQSRALGFLVAIQGLGGFALWFMNRTLGGHSGTP